MDRETIQGIIVSAYAARIRGDLDGVMYHFADGASFSIGGASAAPRMPFGATGREEIREVMRRLFDGVDFLAAEIVTLVVEAPNAAVHSRLRLRRAGSTEEVQTEVVDLLRFDEGRIVSFHQFADTALAAELLTP